MTALSRAVRSLAAAAVLGGGALVVLVVLEMTEVITDPVFTVGLIVVIVLEALALLREALAFLREALAFLRVRRRGKSGSRDGQAVGGDTIRSRPNLGYDPMARRNLGYDPMDGLPRVTRRPTDER